MKKVHVSRLIPGMKLAQPVTGLKGVILWAGEPLTPRAIKRLYLHCVEYVYIDSDGTNGPADEATADIKPVELIPDETRRKAISSVQSAFKKTMQNNKLSRSPEIEETARDLVHYLTRHQRLIQSVTAIRNRDEYLFEHSVNVSALAVMTGACMGLSEDELYHLALCGLFHDIGKIKVPPAILDKPGPLTEEELVEVRKHTIYALELLDYDPVAARVASQHHERYDGSGYPHRLAGDGIDLFAQIIGLVDAYDAMTVDRCYRGAIPVREVIEMLGGSGNYHFNFRVVKAFLANIAPYPVGSRIRLSNGQRGVVVRVGYGFPLYPTVRLLTDSNNNPLPEPQEVDLFNTRTGMIISEVEQPPPQ